MKTLITTLLLALTIISSPAQERMTDTIAADFVFKVVYVMSSDGPWKDTADNAMTDSERVAFLKNIKASIDAYGKQDNKKPKVYKLMKNIVHLLEDRVLLRSNDKAKQGDVLKIASELSSNIKRIAKLAHMPSRFLKNVVEQDVAPDS